MHPYNAQLASELRRRALVEEAAHARLLAGAARLPAAPLHVRVAKRYAARRQALGYLLVEAGLRLAVGRAGHPPPQPSRRPVGAPNA